MNIFFHNVPWWTNQDNKIIKTNKLTHRILRVKNSPLEFEKEVKAINISIDDVDKFEQKNNKEENVC